MMRLACVTVSAFLFFLISVSGAAQILFNPQVGGNYDAISGDFSGYESEGVQLGFLAGTDVRIPESQLHFVPGVYYSDTQSELTTKANDEKLTLDITRLRVPVRVGAYLSDVDNLVRLRLNLGAQASWLMEVESENDLFSKDDFNDTTLDAIVGLGVDIIWLTFDVNYTYGLSPFLKVNDSPSNIFTATIGLALNPRDFD